MDNIFLTVSIAAYNVEQYIEKTLLSCLVKEELRDRLEVLIINDGSTDKTLEVINKFAGKYPKLYKVVDKKNGGYGSTINTALYLAKGKYFRVLDGDDWLNKSTLENLLLHLEERKEDLLLTNVNRVYCEGEKIYKVNLELYGEDIPNTSYQFLETSFIKWSMHSMTVKTELLTQNNVSLLEHCFYTDTEFVFQIMRYMKTYYCFNETLYQYRLGRGGQSVSLEGRLKHRADMLKVFRREMEILGRGKDIDTISKQHLYNYVAFMGNSVIGSYLLCPYNKENCMMVKRIDAEIKNNLPEVYLLMEKKKALKILRCTNYYAYPVCRWNEIRQLKSKK